VGQTNMQVTYQETLSWAVHLRVFTIRDLADAMYVTEDSIGQFIIGLIFNGSVEEIDSVNGRGEAEVVYRWVPLPPGPTHHPTRLPEWIITPGCGSLAPRRGMPVRIRTDRETRRLMSTPGAGHKMRLREQRYQQFVAAKDQRDTAVREKEVRRRQRMDAKKIRQQEKGKRRAEKKKRRRLDFVARMGVV
jgi:hypothetical protein